MGLIVKGHGTLWSSIRHSVHGEELRASSVSPRGGEVARRWWGVVGGRRSSGLLLCCCCCCGWSRGASFDALSVGWLRHIDVCKDAAGSVSAVWVEAARDCLGHFWRWVFANGRRLAGVRAWESAIGRCVVGTMLGGRREAIWHGSIWVREHAWIVVEGRMARSALEWWWVLWVASVGNGSVWKLVASVHVSWHWSVHVLLLMLVVLMLVLVRVRCLGCLELLLVQEGRNGRIVLAKTLGECLVTVSASSEELTDCFLVAGFCGEDESGVSLLVFCIDIHWLLLIYRTGIEGRSDCGDIAGLGSFEKACHELRIGTESGRGPLGVGKAALGGLLINKMLVGSKPFADESRVWVLEQRTDGRTEEGRTRGWMRERYKRTNVTEGRLLRGADERVTLFCLKHRPNQERKDGDDIPCSSACRPWDPW